jgi:hypothetical protein
VIGGEEMGCCYRYGHGPGCWHGDPGVDYYDYPPPYGGPRRRRRFDEETLAAHLEDLEDEVRDVRRLLEELRASRQEARS